MAEPESKAVLYDKNRREIVVGDVLKVYHFTAARYRKRHFMYKQAVAVQPFRNGTGAFLRVGHLNMTGEYYVEPMDGRVLAEYEIVQSIDAKFDLRPKLPLPNTGGRE